LGVKARFVRDNGQRGYKNRTPQEARRDAALRVLSNLFATGLEKAHGFLALGGQPLSVSLVQNTVTDGGQGT
jgi:hypothetical protein